MKCLVIGMHDAVGGVERYIDNYYPFLRKHGIHFDFVSPYPHMALEENMKHMGSAIHAVPSFKRNPIGYLSSLTHIMRNDSYDAVYVNMLSAANVLPFIAARMAGIRHIIAHSHNNATPTGLVRKILHRINYRLVEHCSTDFWACSAVAGKWLFPDVPSKRIVVVPDAIPIENYLFDIHRRNDVRTELGFHDDDIVFGHVGRFEEQKNHIGLIDIFAGIRYHVPHAKLLLVGDGKLKAQIQQQIANHHLQDSVVMAGAVSDVPRYYDAMDAFLFPSLFEGFGMAALEAQSSGLPCLVSEGVPHDIDICDVTHLSIDDPTAWVSAARALATMPLKSATQRMQDGEVCLKSRYSLTHARQFLLGLFNHLD